MLLCHSGFRSQELRKDRLREESTLIGRDALEHLVMGVPRRTPGVGGGNSETSSTGFVNDRFGLYCLGGGAIRSTDGGKGT